MTTSFILLLHFTARESLRGGLLLCFTEIDQLALGTQGIRFVVDLRIDKGHMTHHLIESGLDGYHLVFRGDRFDVFHLHLGSDTNGLQLSGDHPSRQLIHQERLDAAMQSIHIALEVIVRLPTGDDILPILIEIEVKADAIGRTAGETVVPLHT